MNKFYRIIISLIIIGSITATALNAEELKLEMTINWQEKTNQYGSPNNYIYLASYNKVQVLTSDSTKVLSRKMKSYQKMYSSPSGKYWGIARRSEKSGLAPTVTEFLVYAPSGSLIYKINKPAALKFILSDLAPNIVGVAGTEGLPETQLRFFDENGIFTNEHTISNYLGGEFSRDGHSFLAHSADSGLYVFNSSGSLQYRFQIGRNFASSNDGRLIVTINHGKIELYYKTSLTSSAQTSISNPSAILISENKKYALVYTENKAVCYSLPQLDVLWEYVPDESGEQINSCDFNGDAGKFVFGIAIDNGPDHSFTDRFTAGIVEIVDLNGQSGGRGSLIFASWTKGYPRVEFSDSGNSFWVISHHDIYKVLID